MHLQLIIDDQVRQSWYLNEDIEFRKWPGLTFQQHADKNKKIIDDKVLEIKQDYWQDLESCTTWEVRIVIRSSFNRYQYLTT